MTTKVLRMTALAALLLALCAVGIVGILSYRDSQQLLAAVRTTLDARQIITLNESILSQMLNAETGQRGFLLTGNVNYLQPYERSILDVPPRIEQLKAISAGRADLRETVSELQRLVDQKFDELRKTIDLQRTVGTTAAIATVRTDVGKSVMDGIRKVSAQIEDVETARWTAGWQLLTAGCLSAGGARGARQP